MLRRFCMIIGFTAIGSVGMAPIAVADSDDWTNFRTLDCGEDGILETVLNSSGFGSPYHDLNSNRVLVPKLVIGDGVVAIDRGGVVDISCTYTDPAGVFVEVWGNLTGNWPRFQEGQAT